MTSGTAAAMAAGVRRRLHADIGLAVTGVAGPDEQEGQPPGTVFMAVAQGDDEPSSPRRAPGRSRASASSPASRCSTCCGGASSARPRRRPGTASRSSGALARCGCSSACAHPTTCSTSSPTCPAEPKRAALDHPRSVARDAAVPGGGRGPDRGGRRPRRGRRPGFAACEAAVGPVIETLSRQVVALPVAGLDDLAATVIEATHTLGRPPEDRPFRGHLTLARLARSDVAAPGASPAGSWGARCRAVHGVRRPGRPQPPGAGRRPLRGRPRAPPGLALALDGSSPPANRRWCLNEQAFETTVMSFKAPNCHTLSKFGKVIEIAVGVWAPRSHRVASGSRSRRRHNRTTAERTTPVDRQKNLDMALSQIEKQFGKGSVMHMGEEDDGHRSHTHGCPGARSRIGHRWPSPGPPSPRSTGPSRRASPPSLCTSWPRPNATAASAPTSMPSTLSIRSTPRPSASTSTSCSSRSPTRASRHSRSPTCSFARAPSTWWSSTRWPPSPQAEIEGEMGDSHVGLQARLMSQALRKLTANLNKSDTIAVFINQLREKIGVMFGSPETTPGGRAQVLLVGPARYQAHRIHQRRRRGHRQSHPGQGRQEQVRSALRQASSTSCTARASAARARCSMSVWISGS